MLGTERDVHSSQPSEIKEKAGCAFCGIRKKEIPSFGIAESDRAFSFMSLEGHPLVTTKSHISEDLGENIEDVAAAFVLAGELIPFVKEVYGATGVNVVANIGESAGQEVEHFHVHIFPRREGDNGPRLRAVNTPKKKDFGTLAGLISKGFENSKRIINS